MTLAASTRSMKPHPQTFWVYRGLWWKDVRVDGVRLSALATILVFLTLLTVSGPHLVHHFTELHPHADQHTHDGHAPQPPDCHMLFLLQHIPVAEDRIALLPTLLLTGEPIPCPSLLAKTAAPRDTSQARAPPV